MRGRDALELRWRIFGVRFLRDIRDGQTETNEKVHEVSPRVITEVGRLQKQLGQLLSAPLGG